MLRSGMGLAEPHLAAYAQYVNLGFTMRRLYQSACPQTRYDPLVGDMGSGDDRAEMRPIGQ